MAVLESTSMLNEMFKEFYAKRRMEGTMPTYDLDANKAVEETPIRDELNQLQYAVTELRHTIANKQMRLRIQLVKLAAVKKLAKGGK